MIKFRLNLFIISVSAVGITIIFTFGIIGDFLPRATTVADLVACYVGLVMIWICAPLLIYGAWTNRL